MRFLTASVICIAMAFAARAQEMPEPAKALLGCWQHETDPAALILFEAARCRIGNQGKLMFARIKYTPEALILQGLGWRKSWPYALKDGKLHLAASGGGGELIYHRLEKTPLELEPAGVTIGRRQPTPDEIEKIQADLAQRMATVQAPANPMQPRNLEGIDTENTQYLRKLLGDNGWIDIPRFGKDAANAAFWLALRSNDPALLKAIAPELAKAVRQPEKGVALNRMVVQQYAMLVDRARVLEGEKQLYATQVATNPEGAPVILAVEEPGRLDQRRKEIGLDPMAGYLSDLKKQTGQEPKMEE